MRAIAVVTTSRADYGIYRPLLKRLEADPGITLQVIASGMHLLAAFGDTVRDIEADGFAIAARVPCLGAGDSPADIARAIADATAGFASAFETLAPDLVVVLGDRFEMHAAAVAAQPFALPLAHLHGGELTLGAMDDAFRHSITKLSHLHFVSTEEYGARVRQLGEEAWRVIVSGAPGLDNLDELEPLTDDEMAAATGLPATPAPLLVTYHPATREASSAEAQAEGLFHALEQAALPVVFTAPNADEGGRAVRRLIEDFVARHDNAVFVENLGTRAYFGLLARAAAMVGNSSSGIIEAASFRLPVVNIGTRQEGRARAANVIDVAENASAVLDGIRRAASPEFQASLADLRNPYHGERPAAEVIHERLAAIPLDANLIKKRFVDLEPGG